MKGARKNALSQKLDGMNEQKAHLTKELEAVNTYLKEDSLPEGGTST